MGAGKQSITFIAKINKLCGQSCVKVFLEILFNNEQLYKEF